MSDIVITSKVKWPVGEWLAALAQGASYASIARMAGCHRSWVFRLTNGYYRRRPALPELNAPPPPWEADTRPGESPVARAFRRFPITSHKPRFEE